MANKLSYNPLANLDNILWWSMELDSSTRPKAIMYEHGCLSNYTNIVNSNVNNANTFGTGSGDYTNAAQVSFIIPINTITTNIRTYVQYTNSTIIKLVEDLIRYYKVYYYFAHVVTAHNPGQLYNSNTLLPNPAYNFFNLLFTNAIFHKDTSTDTYDIDTMILKNNATNQFSHIIHTTNLIASEFKTPAYYNYKTVVCISSEIENNKEITFTLEYIYTVTGGASGSNNWFTNKYKAAIGSKLTFQLSSNYVFSNIVNAYSYFSYGNAGGISAVYITPKRNVNASTIWNQYLATKPSSDTFSKFDIGTYIGEKSLKPNLIRHVYNDDPLCFIFG